MLQTSGVQEGLVSVDTSASELPRACGRLNAIVLFKDV